MALIKCPECGKEISDRAPACIHCGYPLNAPAAETAPQAAENSLYQLILTGFDGNKKIKCIKAVMEATGMGLADAKTFVENTPSVIRGLTKENLENTKKMIESEGGRVSVKRDNEVVSCNNSFEGGALKVSDIDKVVCPRCGSSAVVVGSRGFSLMTGFIGSGKTVNRCGKCGYKWEPRR